MNRWKWSIVVVVALAGSACGDSSDEEIDGKTSIPKDLTVLVGDVRRSMAMSMPTPGGGPIEMSPPTLTLHTDDGKELPLRRMPGCEGGPEEPTGGVVSLGSQGRYRCRGKLVDGVFDVYVMERLP